MDLNPKPEPTRRVSKRGGMIVMSVLLIIVTLIIYGVFYPGLINFDTAINHLLGSAGESPITQRVTQHVFILSVAYSWQ